MMYASAYASGALVKCRKKGAKNWGNKTKKEGMSFSDFRQISEKRGPCWVGYKQVGMKKRVVKWFLIVYPKNFKPKDRNVGKVMKRRDTKKMFGKTYNNCVKKEEVTNEAAAWTRKIGKEQRGWTQREGKEVV